MHNKILLKREEKQVAVTPMLAGGDGFVRGLLKAVGVSLHPTNIYPHQMMNIQCSYSCSLVLPSLWIAS